MNESVKNFLKSKDRIRILVAAGGSGGHIFPALQVMQALSAIDSIPAGRLKIEFICSTKNIDNQIYSRSGYVFHALNFKGIKGKGLKGYLDFLCSVPKLFREINSLMKSYNPDIVVGFGGFPSVLPVIAANLKGIPSWIHESDQLAGLANKFLSLFANKISTSFDQVKFPFGTTPLYCGHPIRSDLKTAEISDFKSIKNILILGGSQASRSLDLSVPKVLAEIVKSRQLQVMHQARAENLDIVKVLYSQAAIQADVRSFFEDMLAVYDWADIIISRSGSGAVAELAVLNKPVIFVPIPNVSGHQLQNAKWLEKAGKALVLQEGDNFEIRLEDSVERLLDPNCYKSIVTKPFDLRKNNSARLIAENIIDFLSNL